MSRSREEAVQSLLEFPSAKSCQPIGAASYKGMDLENLEGSEQLILESMGEGVCVLDSRGRTTFANPAAAELTGYGPEELTGASHHELLEHSTESGEPYPVEECPMCGTLLRGEPSGSSGALFRGKNGIRLTVGYSSDPIVKDGEVTGAVVVFREVSVRRAEKELKGQGQRRAKEPGGSDEIFRLLVEGVRDYAIFMLDPEGRITTWNAGAERMKGYEAGEIIGEHFSVFYTEEDLRRGHPEEELRIAVSQGRYEEEGWRVRKDGSRFWANVLITALRDNEGRLRGFSKITRDVTERKRAQETLWESEERYRVVAETASDVIVMIDEDSRILFINSAAEGERGAPPGGGRAGRRGHIPGGRGDHAHHRGQRRLPGSAGL